MSVPSNLPMPSRLDRAAAQPAFVADGEADAVRPPVGVGDRPVHALHRVPQPRQAGHERQPAAFAADARDDRECFENLGFLHEIALVAGVFHDLAPAFGVDSDGDPPRSEGFRPHGRRRCGVSCCRARALRQGKQAGTLEFKNHFYLERGPYEIVAVVDENADTEPFVLEGKFIDLFDPALPVLTRRAVLPGTQALLYNLDKVADPGRPQVLACAACVETERVGRNGYSFMVKGPAQTTNVMRVLLPRKLRRAVCPLSDGLRKKRTRPATALPGVCVSAIAGLYSFMPLGISVVSA